MSLIEHLNALDGAAVLQDCFEYVLDVLSTDRFRSLGSAADDLRAWLTAGGVACARERLQHQMERLDFAPEQQNAILACLNQYFAGKRVL